ncbi:S41 family peptidase [Sphingobacterium thalpophilum]|uniref:Carboxy-terminal processing protease CtpB n=1 Tax=Sphingobacterium thalpophilum TaxID=259 RepID=A0A4U9UWP3_9SPHI|nr:S41 family peptidase [Sphingobacterium thalpophilum]VTR37537.1 Carboxy-terminal processing protease CtpB precursor [Sphingobacterium thalpophilum]
MEVRSINTFLASVMFFLFYSCNKKDISVYDISSNKRKITECLDSIYRIAQQVYLWNDQLPAIDRFNPKLFFQEQTNEIKLYENEIFQLTRYPKNTATNEIYEYNLLNPELPKYSTIVQTLPSIDRKPIMDYALSNPFGISVAMENNNIRLLYVDPNSPAGKAGLTRGMQIVSINGEKVISENSFIKQWQIALNLSFIKFEILDLNLRRREVRLNASVYEQNPVVKKLVLDKSNIKIGYLAYNSFTSEENTRKYLEPAFLTFEQSNVSELIVDLRYNQGGFQASVNFLANMIVPSSVNKKIMYSEHYNTLMQMGKADILKSRYLLDQNGKPTYDENGTPITLYDLDYTRSTNTIYFNKESGLHNLKKIYFIISDMTASASELLINIFRPYLDVQIIGVSRTGKQRVKTFGKPVGFFPIKIKQYDLYLSMYQLLNSKNEGHYFKGIPADQTVIDEIETDFGSKEDPAIMAIINNGISKKSHRSLVQKNSLNKTHTSYYLNNDRLQGNLKTVRDLKIRKK